VFLSDPAEVADLFASCLLVGGRYAGAFGAFREAAFAVLDRHGGTIGPFCDRFGS
jgi:hypothetical protein